MLKNKTKHNIQSMIGQTSVGLHIIRAMCLPMAILFKLCKNILKGALAQSSTLPVEGVANEVVMSEL